MDYKEAYKILKKSYPEAKPKVVTEYDSCWVFDSLNGIDEDIFSVAFDTSISVNKTSGEVTTFQPFYISKEEYAKGKRMKIKIKSED